jgi:NADPH:quinone reductase-like Zn-dependent oxidoreductase
MRAVVIRGYGGLDRVVVEEVPRPSVRDPNDVVVALKAAALNRLDLFVIGGLPGVSHTFPHIIGCDGAGVVEAVGGAVTRVKPGDRVMINPGLWCGQCSFCLDGEQSLCTRFQVLGEHVTGTFAEAVRVPEDNVALLAAGVPWAEAAAFPLATLTAWRMVVTRAAVRPAETVLIQGIGGGVALAALASARRLGARVIVTSSSDMKLERARALGADETINYATADVAKEVRRLTDKRGAQVVVDSGGEKSWETSLRCLGRGGRLVTCGGTTGPMVTTDVRRLFWHGWTLMGSTMGNCTEFAQIAALFARGELRPVVDSVLPLEQARAALARMESGGQFGKLVLSIGAEG